LVSLRIMGRKKRQWPICVTLSNNECVSLNIEHVLFLYNLGLRRSRYTTGAIVEEKTLNRAIAAAKERIEILLVQRDCSWIQRWDLTTENNTENRELMTSMRLCEILDQGFERYAHVTIPDTRVLNRTIRENTMLMDSTVVAVETNDAMQQVAFEESSAAVNTAQEIVELEDSRHASRDSQFTPEPFESYFESPNPADDLTKMEEENEQIHAELVELFTPDKETYIGEESHSRAAEEMDVTNLQMSDFIPPRSSTPVPQAVERDLESVKALGPVGKVSQYTFEDCLKHVFLWFNMPQRALDCLLHIQRGAVDAIASLPLTAKTMFRCEQLNSMLKGCKIRKVFVTGEYEKALAKAPKTKAPKAKRQKRNKDNPPAAPKKPREKRKPIKTTRLIGSYVDFNFFAAVMNQSVGEFPSEIYLCKPNFLSISNFFHGDDLETFFFQPFLFFR
jgi:hypothetical protein